jgi:hypothetical protein
MKLSVVTFNRNDGYKEKDRFIIHLKYLLETFDEVIYVDWNSPTHSLLYDIENEIPKTGKLKHFVIPPEVHDSVFGEDPNIPKVVSNFCQNIGLRRTTGDWVAFTTSDNIPPSRDELLNLIKNSDNKTFYTLSRREVEYDEILKNINNLTNFKKELDKISEPRHYPARVSPNDDYSLINCCGDFQFAPREIWWGIKGVEEQMIYSCFIDTNIQKKVVLNGYNLKAIFDIPMYHMSHKNILPQGGDTKNLHEVADKTTPVYNNVLEWVEYFTTSKNTDEWGWSNVEIEYETI